MQANPNGIPTIRDGYRSPQEQAHLPAGSTRVGPCGSYHQYGLAADFDASQNSLRWMRENASRFGLSPVTHANPTTGCTPSGFCDAGHIQIAGPRPPTNQCGICAAGSGGDGKLPSSSTSNSSAGSGGSSGGMSGGAPGPASLPDDIQPYTPKAPGVCDPGYSFISGLCNFGTPSSSVNPPAPAPAGSAGISSQSSPPPGAYSLQQSLPNASLTDFFPQTGSTSAFLAVSRQHD